MCTGSFLRTLYIQQCISCYILYLNFIYNDIYINDIYYMYAYNIL